MKKIMVLFAGAAVIACVAVFAHAVERPEKAPFKAPAQLPAEIQGFRYIAGPVSISHDPTTSDYPKVAADLEKKEFAITKQRIDPSTVNKKSRKYEMVDLVRVPYKKIKDVWYGEEAIKKLSVTSLPSIPNTIWDYRSSSYQPLNVFLDQRNRAPVVVLFDCDKKKEGAVVVLGPEDKSFGLYSMLTDQAGRKKKKK